MALKLNHHTSISIISINIIGTVLLCYLLWNNILLRWHLNYYVFAITVLTGIAFLFIENKNKTLRDLGKLYGICWSFIAVIGLLICRVTYSPAPCESGDYVMRRSSGVIGFETARLYKKSILREVEVWRYELVYPKKIVPLDSLGAVVIYGDYPDGNGGLTSDTTIYPMSDSYYDNLPAIKEFSEKHNIPYQKLQ